MAISKRVQLASLTIEVKNGEDKAGDPTYSKKSFSNVRTDVKVENAYAVAEAIKGVLSEDTRFPFLNESSLLLNS